MRRKSDLLRYIFFADFFIFYYFFKISAFFVVNLLFSLCYTVFKDKKAIEKERSIMAKTKGFKFNVRLFLIFILGFIVVWIGADFVYTTLIRHSGFVFSAVRDLMIPLLIAAPAGVFTQLLSTE